MRKPSCCLNRPESHCIAPLLAEFEKRIAVLGQTIARGVASRGTHNDAAVQGVLTYGGAAERTAKTTVAGQQSIAPFTNQTASDSFGTKG